MKAFTAQIGKFDGDIALDITVKTAKGDARLFAPTWDMVIGSKNGTLSHWDYYLKYWNEILVPNFEKHPEVFLRLFEQDAICFTCYCRRGKFCHRHLFVNFLSDIAICHGLELERGGEIPALKQPNTEKVEQLSLFYP